MNLISALFPQFRTPAAALAAFRPGGGRRRLRWMPLLPLLLGLPAGAATVLFVHAPSGGTPTATDQALVDELARGLGHAVQLRGVLSAADKPAAAEAEAVDLVVVSESVSSGNVTDAFKATTRPVLILEGFIADDMDVATPGLINAQTQVEIADPDHPLAAGLSGTVDVYREARTLLTFTGFPEGAIQVGTGVGAPEAAAVLAYVRGQEMLNGFAAPGRRVCLGLHSAVPEVYTPQARALFRAAVNWCLSPEKKVLFVHAPSGGTPTATDQALVDELARGLGHAVQLRGVLSAADKPAAAEAEAVDLVVVSESVSSGNVTDAFKATTRPVLILEGFIADDMDVATPGLINAQTQVEIADPDHPLAAGLSGTVDVYREARTLLTFTGFPEGAIQVGTGVGAPEAAAVLAYVRGQEMLNGFAAPGRRVCLGLHSAVPEVYTPQARALFRAAVNWCLSPEKKVLFVHAPSGGTPTATDQALVDELARGLGHAVQLRGVLSAADKPAAAEAEAVDLVVVSESVSSGNVTDAFKATTRPVLILEGFIADDMDVATPGLINAQTQVEIADPDHPLAAGLSGTVDVYREARTLLTFTGFPEGAIQVGTGVGAPEAAAVLAYVRGQEMLNGFAAPGRRVCLGLHSAVPEVYTPQARALFRAAATWSLGLPVETASSQSKPIIARGPADARVFAGQQAEFIVEARGTAPLAYQWRRGTTDIPGATDPILRFRATMADDGAAFRVVVQNALGAVTSAPPARLTVLADDGRKVLAAFAEGVGATTTNRGNLGGSGRFALAQGFPRFAAQVPAGPFAPPGNAGSVDFGVIEEGQGGRAIDFSNPFGGTLGSYNALTICGWLNLRDLTTGPGGNRIAFAASGIGGPGFDLVHTADGALKLGVNGTPDAAPESSALLTADPAAGPGNWVFFAVTYDGEAGGGQVAYYFGTGAAAAALDSAHDLPSGVLESTGQLALGNFAPVDLNRNVQGPNNSRVLRGLLDEFKIFGRALTLAEIQEEQRKPISTPAVPAPLAIARSGGQVVISWPTGSAFLLESRRDAAQGAWSVVPIPPVVSGGRNTVTAPVSGAAEFFRLRSQP